MDDAAPKKGGWLGRVIVVLVVWVALAAGAYYVLIVLSAGRTPAPAPPPAPGDPHGPVVAQPTPPTPTDWTPALIAEKPAAFLESAIARSRDLAAARQRRLDETARQREGAKAQADERQRTLADKRNVRERLQRAYRAAQDEDRWPMRVAGQTFERAHAEQVLRDLERELQELQPLAEGYAQTAAEYEAREAALRQQIDSLNRLRERLQLDLERARLDVKHVSVAELQKADSRLDAMDRE